MSLAQMFANGQASIPTVRYHLEVTCTVPFIVEPKGMAVCMDMLDVHAGRALPQARCNSVAIPISEKG